MSVMTITTTIDYRYLMNKSKDDLAHMYLELYRDYWKERENNTPRPQYGIKIVLDESLPKDEIRIVDGQGRKIGSVEV